MTKLSYFPFKIPEFFVRLGPAKRQSFQLGTSGVGNVRSFSSKLRHLQYLSKAGYLYYLSKLGSAAAPGVLPVGLPVPVLAVSREPVVGDGGESVECAGGTRK